MAYCEHRLADAERNPDATMNTSTKVRPRDRRVRVPDGAWRRKPGKHMGAKPKPRPWLARVLVPTAYALGGLPLGLARALGRTVGALGSRLPTNKRHIAEANVRLALPEMDEARRRRLVRRSFAETGKAVAEIGAIWRWDRDRILGLARGVSGEHHVRRAIDSGRGVVIAAPHLGAWEFVAMYCSARWPMTILYRAPRIPEANAFVTESRGRFGARVVPAGIGAARSLLRALRRGELAGVAPDQDAGEGAGIYVPFFGVPVNTMTLVSGLVSRSNAVVVLTYAERLPGSAGFHLHFVPASEPVYDSSVERSTTALNADIEKLIRSLPGQYLWSYKRFRVLPPGVSSPYRRPKIKQGGRSSV